MLDAMLYQSQKVTKMKMYKTIFGMSAISISLITCLLTYVQSYLLSCLGKSLQGRKLCDILEYKLSFPIDLNTFLYFMKKVV